MRARRLIAAFQHRLSQHKGEGVDEVLTRLAAQDLDLSRETQPKTLEVLRFLDGSLTEAAEFDPEIAASIAALAPELEWMQSSAYTDAVLGAGFTAN